MRNFKKFLSLVLAALMVSGMMVFTAPAASAADYEATGDYADSITLLNTLEVMLGNGESFDEKGKVTRWQMALFIARIVTGEVGNDLWEADKSQIFTDVAANHYPGAIDFCAELGIINGIGDGKFNPDGNITYQDALTMFVRLLGYEKSTTTYPWGYILTAVKLETENGLLTDGIDTKYTADLLREEVAQLLVNALYAYQAKTDGTQGTSTLMVTGLKAQELGVYTLVATDFASINGTVAAAGKVTFAAEGKDNVSIAPASVTKGDLELVNYLGATATLISIKGKTYATMDKYTVIDNYGAKAFEISGAKIKVGSTAYNTVVYGEALTEVFVAAEAEDLNLYGRVYIFDVNGDGKTANDFARFVPFTEAKALYPITVKVEKKNSWPADGNVTLYYVPEKGYSVAVNEAGMFMYPQVGKTDGNQPGLNLGKTMSNSKTDKTARTALGGWAWRESTSLRVITDGKVVFGNVFVGGYTKIGEYTFLTVGEDLEIVKGTATLTGIGEDSVKLGDTSFKVGFVDLGVVTNGWYEKFADLGADVVALLNKEVDYVTVNGQIVAIAKKGTAPAATPVASDPLTKDSLLLYIQTNGKNVSVNADGTLTIQAYDETYVNLKSIVVDQINGTKLGSLINQFGLNTAATIVGAPSADLDAMILHLVSANANPYVNTTYDKAANRVLVAVANKADDVYSVSTTAKDLAAIKEVVTKATTLEFTNYKTSALSSKYSLGTWKDGKYNYADKYLTLNAESEVVVIGTNGCAIYKNFVPANKDFLKISANAVVFELSSSRVVVFDPSVETTELAKFTTATVSTPVEFKGGYYTLTWKTDYTAIDVTTENNVPVFHYTFENMYDLATRTYATVVLSSKEYYTEPETAFFGSHWAAGEAPTSASADNLLVYDFWYLTNDVAETNECVTLSNLIEWAVANKYQIGRLAKGSIVANDPNTLIIDAYTINEDGKSATNKNDDAENARNVSVVVNFSGLYFNQSANSVKDEINIFDCKIHSTTGNSGYIKKATETTKEWVAYKITDEGIADIIVNCADNLK